MLCLVFDADAFLAARSLDLLEDLCALSAAQAVDLVLTGYVARHELSDLAREWGLLAAAMQLRVVPIGTDSPAGQRFRHWLKMRPRPADKGELEIVAWALEEQRDDLTFVSCDRGALAFAASQGLRATDLLGLVCTLVERRLIELQPAKRRLLPWDETFTGRCRPKGYAGLEEALRRRAR